MQKSVSGIFALRCTCNLQGGRFPAGQVSSFSTVF
jgi:hypothetical protein